MTKQTLHQIVTSLISIGNCVVNKEDRDLSDTLQKLGLCHLSTMRTRVGVYMTLTCTEKMVDHITMWLKANYIDLRNKGV